MVRVGIIGAGTIARFRHIPELSSNPDAEITSYLTHSNPEKLQQLTETYGGKVYTDLAEFIAGGIDAAVVCNPNAKHAEVALELMRHGIHVLCEKPMATTIEDCEKMVACAKENNVKFMVAQNQRFLAPHVKARELIASGAIGKVLSFDTVYAHAGPENWSKNPNPWFFDKKTSVFGAFADLGIHKTDLIHYLIDDTIVEVGCILSTVDKKYPDGTMINVDDNAFCIYRTESGIGGTLHVSWTQYAEEINTVTVQGTEGCVHCFRDPEYSCVLQRRDGTEEKFAFEDDESNEAVTSGRGTNSGVSEEFIRSILEDREPLSSGEENLRSMKVVFAAQKSAQEGRIVHV